MKLKQIATLCKDRGIVILLDRETGEDSCEQWIGDGGSLYPVTGLPYLDMEAVATIFELTEKQKEKMCFKHQQVPERTNLADIDEHERRAELESISLRYGGIDLKPIRTSNGMEFITKKYLKPLQDIWDMMEFFERGSGEQTYFVVKNGMFAAAAIMPYNIFDEAFVKKMDELAFQSRAAMERWSQRKSGTENAVGMKTDPGTGEILEE